MKKVFLAKLVLHVNRKKWWHVPSRYPRAYSQRGKFLASSFREAEFWGRPLDEPQKVVVRKPLVGDELSIEKALFSKRVSDQQITMNQRWALDAKIRKVALREGFDSVVLMTAKGFAKFKATGEIPRSMELNVLRASSSFGMRTAKLNRLMNVRERESDQ